MYSTECVSHAKLLPRNESPAYALARIDSGGRGPVWSWRASGSSLGLGQKAADIRCYRDEGSVIKARTQDAQFLFIGRISWTDYQVLNLGYRASKQDNGRT